MRSGLLDRVKASLDDADIPWLVDVLCNGRHGSITGFVTLNEDDCTAIYRMML